MKIFLWHISTIVGKSELFQAMMIDLSIEQINTNISHAQYIKSYLHVSEQDVKEWNVQ